MRPPQGGPLDGATGPDQSDYLQAVADILARDMAENRADTPYQARGRTESHEDDHDTVADHQEPAEARRDGARAGRRLPSAADGPEDGLGIV